MTHNFNDKSLLDVMRFWDDRPCNIMHSTHQPGSYAWSKEVTWRKRFVEPHIPEFADFKAWEGKKVLEIGCGIGTDTLAFLEAGARVTAVELSRRSIQLAEKRVPEGLKHRVAFYIGDCENLSEYIPPEKYDLVYSFGVLHHILNPRRAVKQIRKFMHSQSILKIMLYNRWSWKVLGILLREFPFSNIDRVVARWSEAQTGCPVTYTFTPAMAGDLLQGFKILKMTKEHIFPYKIKDYVNYRYRWHWYFVMLPDRVFRWLEHKLGWHLCITARPE